MDKPLGVNYDELNKVIQCYAETIYRFNGVWEGPDPLSPIVPLFLIQITLAILATRLLILALRPFNQPPFVAEILGGIILGPSVFGRIDGYRKLLFPSYNMKILEPMAHYALVFYAFLMGLQMDVRAITRTGAKASRVAIAGTVLPLLIGLTLFFMSMTDDPNKEGAFFWGSALTVTGFGVLAKILDKQKLLQTEIGKTALAASLINDIGSWFFLGLGFLITGSKKNIQWSLISTAIFIAFCASRFRGDLKWIIRKTPEGQGYSEFYICSILTGAALFGVITDAFGTHPMIGAFLFGLLIPNDVLQATLLERLEDFVMGIFMPIFFVVCGLRTNVDVISTGTSWIVVILVIIIASFAKVLSALLLVVIDDMKPREAMAIGALTNTKSVMAMVILEVGQTQGVVSLNQTCIYRTSNVPTIINLLEASNSTHRSPINVFGLHLVELIGRASAMLIVHSSRRAGPRNPSHVEAQTDQILNAFDNYELRSEGVTTQVLTARSAYSTMDEDICTIAKDKQAAFIIIPFHRQQTIDGDMEELNPALRTVNEGVLANAPCSVGILIHRGGSESRNHPRHIAMLFFGGPDDREALAYAWRMAEHPENRLTVVRFIPGDNAVDSGFPREIDFVEKTYMTIHIDAERERMLDDDFLNKFKISTEHDDSITYSELVLNDEEETVNAIKSLDNHRYDLYLVGKGRGMTSPLTTGLADWCDCPELGPIGDLLVTSEFESRFEVLVVQQYVKPPEPREGSVRSTGSMSERPEMEIRTSMSGSESFEQYSSFRRRDLNA